MSKTEQNTTRSKPSTGQQPTSRDGQSLVVNTPNKTPFEEINDLLSIDEELFSSEPLEEHVDLVKQRCKQLLDKFCDYDKNRDLNKVLVERSLNRLQKFIDKTTGHFNQEITKKNENLVALRKVLVKTYTSIADEWSKYVDDFFHFESDDIDLYDFFTAENLQEERLWLDDRADVINKARTTEPNQDNPQTGNYVESDLADKYKLLRLPDIRRVVSFFEANYRKPICVSGDIEGDNGGIGKSVVAFIVARYLDTSLEASYGALIDEDYGTYGKMFRDGVLYVRLDKETKSNLNPYLRQIAEQLGVTPNFRDNALPIKAAEKTNKRLVDNNKLEFGYEPDDKRQDILEAIKEEKGIDAEVVIHNQPDGDNTEQDKTGGVTDATHRVDVDDHEASAEGGEPARGKVSRIEELVYLVDKLDVLLIIDNAEQNPWAFNQLFSKFNSFAAILVTSRHSMPSIKNVKLKNLDLKDCEELFFGSLDFTSKKHIGLARQSVESILFLCEGILEGHSQSIHLAARMIATDFINGSNWTREDFEKDVIDFGKNVQRYMRENESRDMHRTYLKVFALAEQLSIKEVEYLSKAGWLGVGSYDAATVNHYIYKANDVNVLDSLVSKGVVRKIPAQDFRYRKYKNLHEIHQIFHDYARRKNEEFLQQFLRDNFGVFVNSKNCLEVCNRELSILKGKELYGYHFDVFTGYSLLELKLKMRLAVGPLGELTSLHLNACLWTIHSQPDYGKKLVLLQKLREIESVNQKFVDRAILNTRRFYDPTPQLLSDYTAKLRSAYLADFRYDIGSITSQVGQLCAVLDLRHANVINSCQEANRVQNGGLNDESLIGQYRSVIIQRIFEHGYAGANLDDLFGDLIKIKTAKRASSEHSSDRSVYDYFWILYAVQRAMPDLNPAAYQKFRRLAKAEYLRHAKEPDKEPAKESDKEPDKEKFEIAFLAVDLLFAFNLGEYGRGEDAIKPEQVHDFDDRVFAYAVRIAQEIMLGKRVPKACNVILEKDRVRIQNTLYLFTVIECVISLLQRKEEISKRRLIAVHKQLIKNLRGEEFDEWEATINASESPGYSYIHGGRNYRNPQRAYLFTYNTIRQDLYPLLNDSSKYSGNEYDMGYYMYPFEISTSPVSEGEFNGFSFTKKSSSFLAKVKEYCSYHEASIPCKEELIHAASPVVYDALRKGALPQLAESDQLDQNAYFARAIHQQEFVRTVRFASVRKSTNFGHGDKNIEEDQPAGTIPEQIRIEAERIADSDQRYFGFPAELLDLVCYNFLIKGVTTKCTMLKRLSNILDNRPKLVRIIQRLIMSRSTAETQQEFGELIYNSREEFRMALYNFLDGSEHEPIVIEEELCLLHKTDGDKEDQCLMVVTRDGASFKVKEFDEDRFIPFRMVKPRPILLDQLKYILA